jgi:hypothetical protein
MADFNSAFGGDNLVQRIIDDIGINNFHSIESNSGSQLDPEYKITFDVKEALTKYRVMKAEVMVLQEKKKELNKKSSSIYPLLQELNKFNEKLFDYLISPVTSGHFINYEKALRTELMAKRIEYDTESGAIGKQIKELEEKIHDITQFIKEGVKGEISDEEIQRLRDPNLCAICVEDKVTHVFNPCGHTVCSGCIDPTLTRCHLCRKQIMTKIKIFFS